MKSLRVLILCAAFSLPSVFAQSSSDATLQALVAEVRQLRLALERSTVVVPKVQMTLQRLQLQQETVARASRELDLVRSQIAKSAEEQVSLAAEIKQGDAMITQEPDAARRKQIEEQLRSMKFALEQQPVRSSEVRGREAELSGRLRTEQAKLDDLNGHLNSLEKLLEGPQPK